MARVHTSENYVNPFIIGGKQPLDVRTVLSEVNDLKNRTILTSAYKGMVVYVVEDSSLYVCHTESRTLTNVEDGWRKIDSDYSVRVVENESNLTDGTIFLPYKGMMAYVTTESSLYILLTKGIENSKDINNWRKIDSDYSVRIVENESNLTDGTIFLPYKGMMVYVTTESSLYILLTKGIENSKDINNWRKIYSTSSTSSKDKVGINVEPEGGSGFKITKNKDVIIEDYVNVENYIKSNYFYTSKGINSYDYNPNFIYDSIKLSKEGDSYIELYANGDNWITIYDPNNTFGFSIKKKISNTEDWEFVYADDNGYITIEKEISICFSVDIKFTEGWKISYGNLEPREFKEIDYELIDIYRSEYSPEVYVYLNGIDTKILTDNDIDTLQDLIMIDIGDSDLYNSDGNILEQISLQKVIFNINNDIDKLEKKIVEPEFINTNEIDNLFNKK